MSNFFEELYPLPLLTYAKLNWNSDSRIFTKFVIKDSSTCASQFLHSCKYVKKHVKNSPLGTFCCRFENFLHFFVLFHPLLHTLSVFILVDAIQSKNRETRQWCVIYYSKIEERNEKKKKSLRERVTIVHKILHFDFVLFFLILFFFTIWLAYFTLIFSFTFLFFLSNLKLMSAFGVLFSFLQTNNNCLRSFIMSENVKIPKKINIVAQHGGEIKVRMVFQYISKVPATDNEEINFRRGWINPCNSYWLVIQSLIAGSIYQEHSTLVNFSQKLEPSINTSYTERNFK